jgi:uncharacterized RDD family membrane protein YckC
MAQARPPEAEHPEGGAGASWQTTPRTPQPPVVPPSAGSSSWSRGLTPGAPSPGPAGYVYADVPNRVIAYIVDIIVLAVIGGLVALLIGGLLGGIVTTGLGEAGFQATTSLNLVPFLVLAVVDLGISLVYFAWSWSVQRGTPGMKLLGLQIGDERDGRSIGFDQALVRWVILGIPSILSTFAATVSDTLGVVLSGIALVWLAVLLYSIAQSPTKQGFHDRYARTVMVKSARRVA